MSVTNLPTVLGLAEARASWTNFDAIISIEDVGAEEGRSFRFPDQLQRARPAHLRLVFDDIDEAAEGYVGPNTEQVRQALAFAREHHDQRLLVHCHSGQCRSTAIALGAIAERFGPGREADAIATILRIRPIAAPNLLVLEHVDRELGRNGALQGAWMNHENADSKLLRLRFLRKSYYATSPIAHP
ncbi:putative protein tyrosine phosphatase [Bradyrhizobium sp. USDA 4341]